MHTLTVGVVLNVRNTVNSLVFHKVGNVFDKSCLVDLIRQFGNNNLVSAVFSLYNLCFGSHGNFTSAGRISGSYTASAHNNAACRKVRAGHIVHKTGKVNIGIINKRTSGVNGFAKVVRRNLCSHTYGDTVRTVYKQVRKSARKYGWLFKSVVKVRLKINRLFVNIGKHFARNLAHSRLCVSVCGRRVTVNRTEVTVAVNKHISH